MKTTLATTLALLMLLSLGGGAVAQEGTVTVTTDLERLATPRAGYYIRASATDSEIVENAARLFEKLNLHTNAGLDHRLLGKAGRDGWWRVDMADRRFYSLGPDSSGFVYSRDVGQQLRPAEHHERRLPDAVESARLAQDYLAKLELLPTDSSEMYVSKVNVIRGASCSRSECLAGADRMRVVFFGRRLDGLPVHGASRMAVRVGRDGELVGVIKNWPKLVPVAVDSATGLVAKAQWKAAAVRTVRKLQAGSSHPNATLESSEVVLYDDGRGFVEPALRVKGKKLDKAGSEAPATWLVPLLTAPKARYADSVASEDRPSLGE